ncbi:RNA pyrophosphohydrolase [Lactovum miscens]|uniref:Putative (Di)nucleoside polyphosphate hydrolase n=1 Tax=Lactovum miscens TaxID=190387 RepID=A0A841C454_9LACT|nr:RNA pyrophosphohydrolase [Lactovum miscens]MBB5887185.1 putative (di)nucleoside polyphosphate hydrolase [Lactovum miscens]
MRKYRSNVAAIVMNSNGKLLIFERSDHQGWGFPQGGKEVGESDEETLKREISEELGTTDYELLAKAPDLLRYEFGEGLKPLGTEFIGQEQQYFLIQLGQNVQINFNTFPEEIEFLSWKELGLKEVEAMNFGVKNKVYHQVLKYFQEFLK